MCVYCFRYGRSFLPEIFRLHWGSVLCPPLLVQDMQAGAERGSGVHQAQEERYSCSGAFPALWLWRRSELQDAERRSQQGLTKPPYMPETLRCSIWIHGLFPECFWEAGACLKEHRKTSPAEMDMKWEFYFIVLISFHLQLCVSTSQSRYKCFSMELGIWWLQYITVL